MAAEDKHEEAFLLTQQVDEARHTQHFDRLFEEVYSCGRRHATPRLQHGSGSGWSRRCPRRRG